MKYSEGNIGRVFVLRLEDGDIIHETIEKFAKEKKIFCAGVNIVGGADKSSSLVVGPEKGRSEKIIPMKTQLNEVHEMTGSGTIFPNEKGDPILHLHLACGRKNETITGCIRAGVKTWHLGEVIIYEILNINSVRKKDAKLGFELLEP